MVCRTASACGYQEIVIATEVQSNENNTMFGQHSGWQYIVEYLNI